MPAYEPDLFPSQGRSNVPGKQTFHVKLTFGSSVLTSYKGKYMTVARNSAGNYTITFPRPYRELVNFRAGWLKCAAGAVYFPVILTNSIDTDGTVVVEIRTEAGTATDPASGNIIALVFDVTLDVLNDDGTVTV